MHVLAQMRQEVLLRVPEPRFRAAFLGVGRVLPVLEGGPRSFAATAAESAKASTRSADCVTQGKIMRALLNMMQCLP